MKYLILAATLILSGCNEFVQESINDAPIVVTRDGQPVMKIFYNTELNPCSLNEYKDGDDLIIHIKAGQGVSVRRY